MKPYIPDYPEKDWSKGKRWLVYSALALNAIISLIALILLVGGKI